MNNFILILQRNKSVQWVFEKYPEVYEGKTEIEAALETFSANNTRITVITALLARPISVVFGSKKDQAKKLRVSLSRVSGVGMLLATRQNDEPKLNMYKSYKKQASGSSAWDLYHASLQVAAEMAKEGAQAADAGLAVIELTAFKKQADDFGLLIESTAKEMKDRKSARQERATLTKENIAILRYQLDPYANLVQELYVAFYRDFKIARRSPLPHKAADKTAETLTEISGTATNSATNEPVAGATVMITELEMVTTTDDDGYYLLDEVPVGAFILTCHALNFKLPAPEPVTFTGTDDLQLNFSLEPEVSVVVA